MSLPCATDSMKTAMDCNSLHRHFRLTVVLTLLGIASFLQAADGPAPARAARKVDTTSLTGKVMVGYQGWFNCPSDGANLGWKHWARNRKAPFGPGNVTVDLWPDVSELDADERYPTGFRHADGSAAEVFSSANRKTVLRHFRWMQEYGIDGAFLQRFAVGLAGPASLSNNNTVLSHVREGAKQSGRAFAVMYDLSGLQTGQVKRVRDDWQRLRLEWKVTSDSTYLHHHGEPLVAIWGIGFSDDRRYSLSECHKLVKQLKSDGCSVMLGVPSFWREGTRDATSDPLLHKILKDADIVSPWTIGRYRTPDEARRHASQIWQPDRQWCEREKLDFLPVVFPGFSWHNLTGGRLNQIPRRKGDFFWSQISAAKQIGCEMIYVAMFDEVDEATAIFKCTNEPPVGDGAEFLTLEGLPSDHYLKLTGRAGKLLRGEQEKDAVSRSSHAEKTEQLFAILDDRNRFAITADILRERFEAVAVSRFFQENGYGTVSVGEPFHSPHCDHGKVMRNGSRRFLNSRQTAVGAALRTLTDEKRELLP